MIYQVGLIPSQFYEVLSDKNYGRFRDLVAFAVFLILINSAVSLSNIYEQMRYIKPVLHKIIYFRARHLCTLMPSVLMLGGFRLYEILRKAKFIINH